MMVNSQHERRSNHDRREQDVGESRDLDERRWVPERRTPIVEETAFDDVIEVHPVGDSGYHPLAYLPYLPDSGKNDSAH